MDHNKLQTFFKEMGIPDQFTCLLRNLYAGQEAAVRTERGTTVWLKTGKGEHDGEQEEKGLTDDEMVE